MRLNHVTTIGIESILALAMPVTKFVAPGPDVAKHTPTLFVVRESAEMTKHAINSFLATSVVFANEIASICDTSQIKSFARCIFLNCSWFR